MGSPEYEKLTQLLRSLRYKDAERTAIDVLQATNKYPGLSTVVENFGLNNGTEEPRLVLLGTLPIQNEGVDYNIPVLIWMPPNYPCDPQVFITPTNNMLLKRDRSPITVFDSGECSLRFNPYLNYDNLLVHTIDVLVKGFSKGLPVEFCPETTMTQPAAAAPVLEPFPLPSNKLELKKALSDHLYENVDATLSEILKALSKYDGLKPVLDNFALNNGNPPERRLTLTGVIVIEKEGASYKVPIVIWLHRAYPNNSFEVFVKRSAETVFTTMFYRIFEQSRLYALAQWDNDLFSTYTLVNKLDALCSAFHHEPPIQLRPQKTGTGSTISCLLCSKEADENDCWLLDGVLFKTLCELMMSNHSDDIQKEFMYEEKLSFCSSCHELVEELRNCQESIRKAQLRVAEITRSIEKTVGESEMAAPDLLPEKTGIHKLRKVICEEYRRRTQAEETRNNEIVQEKENQNVESCQTSGLAAASPCLLAVDNNVVEMNGSECTSTTTGVSSSDELHVSQNGTLDEAVVKEEVEEHCDDAGNSQAEGFDEDLIEEEHNIIKLEVDDEGETRSEGIVVDNADEDLFDSFEGESTGSSEIIGIESLNVPASVPTVDDVIRSAAKFRQREGTLLVDGCVDLYWNSGGAYLECSICHFELRFSTTSAKGMEEGCKTMEEHIQKNHQDRKDEITLRFGRKESHKCSWTGCEVLFANPESRDKHEVTHRTCNVCWKQIGDKRNSAERIQQALNSHRRSHSGDKKRKGGEQVVSVNKKTKNK